MTSITRRTALKAAPAVALTAAVPVVASSDGGSEIIRLFWEEQHLIEQADEAMQNGLRDEAEINARFYDRIFEINDLMECIPSTSAADFAAKAVSFTARGGNCLSWESDPFWIEARVLLGLPDPAEEVASVAPPRPESEIMRLFREWEAIYADDSSGDDEVDRVTLIEAQIAFLTPKNVREYALKMIVWTVYGTEINGCHMDDEIVAEMLALAGVTIPWNMA